MISYYIRTAYRNLLKNRLISIINLFGLTTGLAFCIMVGMYVSYEFNYDKFNKNSENIYRVICYLRTNEEITHRYTGTPSPLGRALVDEFAEVRSFARFSNWGGDILHHENTYLQGNDVYLADPSIFEMFNIKFVQGNSEEALKQANGAIVTEEFAQKLFGTRNAIGKIFDYKKDGKTYEVTGIVDNMPLNSHWRFNVLLPIQDLANSPEIINDWYDNFGFTTYVTMEPKADYETLNTKTRALYKRNYGEDDGTEFIFQPLEKIHFYSSDLNWEPVRGDLNNVYFLLLVGLFIIIIAWVNYINLSVSKSLERASEIGILKVQGAQRSQLITQFLTETILLNLAALIASILVVLLLVPLFNQNFGIELSLGMINSKFWFFLLLFLILGILASGYYPALVISKFKPSSLMSWYKSKDGGVLVRRAMVVVQFVICVFFIACNVIVFKQLNYLKEIDLGIDLKHIALVANPTQLKLSDDPIVEKSTIFRNELIKLAPIENVTLSNHPGSGFFSKYELYADGSPEEKHMIEFAYIDQEFLDVYGLQLKGGRNITDSGNDEFTDILINEKAAQLLGFKRPETAIGQQLVGYKDQKLRVIGVINNYHQESAKVAIPPVLYKAHPYSANQYYSIKFSGEDPNRLRDILQGEFSKFFPESVFEFVLLEDLYGWQFIGDTRFLKLFTFLSLVALILSCMGLLALSSHIMYSKTREIGIRKSLGASGWNISSLLLKEILISALVASGIALIIAYFLSANWLDNFANQVGMGWWFFLVPILILFPVILATVLYHTMKLVRVDTVKALSQN